MEALTLSFDALPVFNAVESCYGLEAGYVTGFSPNIILRAENSTADTCDAPVVRAGTGTISYRPYRYSGQSRIDAKNSRSTPPWPAMAPWDLRSHP